MDETVHDVLSTLNLPGIFPISLSDFERGDKRLQAAKADRSRIEYYFTCTPSLPRYILDSYPNLPRITYVDADLYFFGEPALLSDEVERHSIVIHPHRFPPEQSHRADLVGEFNVGFVSIRNDEVGRACIEWWRDRCLEWCYDRKEDGKFADQKYLDEWPSRFDDVYVLDSPGAGLARWNVGQYDLGYNGIYVTVEGDPLVFYHFERLQKLTDWLWDPHVRLTPVLKRQIYEPYVKARERAERTVRRATDKNIKSGSLRRGLLVTDDQPHMNILRTAYRLSRLLVVTARGDLIIRFAHR